MKRMQTILILAASLLLTTGGQAALRTIEKGLELDTGKVRLPQHSADQVVVRQCAGCEPFILRVDGQTTYHLGIGSPAVRLDTLLDAAGSPRTGKYPVYIFYRPEQKVVTRLVLGK